jgi:hypothetical protein
VGRFEFCYAGDGCAFRASLIAALHESESGPLLKSLKRLDISAYGGSAEMPELIGRRRRHRSVSSVSSVQERTRVQGPGVAPGSRPSAPERPAPFGTASPVSLPRAGLPKPRRPAGRTNGGSGRAQPPCCLSRCHSALMARPVVAVGVGWFQYHQSWAGKQPHVRSAPESFGDWAVRADRSAY